MSEVEQIPHTNGVDLNDDDENNKSRPADIEADMREMERRKRVEAIMQSRLFREELERIVDSHGRDGATGLLQQLSDMVGVPAARVGSVFKSSNCVLPINDIRGVESMGYAKGEKILRCKLAATFRLLDLHGFAQCLGAHVTARLNADQELFLVNPSGLLSHEVTASSLNKVDMQGTVVQYGTTNFGINSRQYHLHSAVHAARPDIRCAIYVGCSPVVAVSALKVGLLPLTQDAAVLGEVTLHKYTGALSEPEEREKLIHSLGPLSKVLLLTNHGALCCGETIEEAFFAAYHIVQACETQLKMLPLGIDNLNLIPEEERKAIYDASRRAPDGYETRANQLPAENNKVAATPKWRVGGSEFEALMRMLDNAGFRTGYIYRNPLVKSELPKPRSDVEVPPAVSSLGYLLEEEELYRQGIWKKGDLRKGGDRTRWLNSPNVYQKVEVLETGTPDPKKITKWVADGSPNHSTAVRIENPLQFVPTGTNAKEFKKLQQQIKDNRRADKISAGPQSHILEGVTWDEASRIKDATVSGASDHVVLMGAASKGIIQRGYQHNATVYKTPYAKNPFDCVTDDELNDYKKTVERKRHGDYTDTDFSESECLSSLQISSGPAKSSAISQSEAESEHQVHRIETKQAPVPSQPEVVLSDANSDFLNVERVHAGKPPTGRVTVESVATQTNPIQSPIHSHAPQQQRPSSRRLYPDAIETISHQNPHSTTHSPPHTNTALIHHSALCNQITTAIVNHSNAHNNTRRHRDGSLQPSSTSSSSTTTGGPPPRASDYDSDHIVDYSLLPMAASHANVYDYVRNCLAIEMGTPDFGGTSSTFSGAIGCEASPYRTHSHSGFQSPRRDTRPTHYHTGWATTQYVPLPRALSISELFASGRVLRCADAEVPQLLRCAIEQRPALSLGALPPLPRDPCQREEEQQQRQQEQQHQQQHQQRGDDYQIPRAEFLRRMCQLEEHFANVSLHNKSIGETRALSDKEAAAVAQVVTAADVHVDAMDEVVQEFSRQLIVEIIENVLLQDGACVEQQQQKQPAHPATVNTENKENMSGDMESVTFLRKIDAMSYSTESPNIEYEQKIAAVEPKPLQDLNGNTTPVKSRPLMMRNERLQRQEQFIELIHDHHNALPPPPPSCLDETSDRSLYDPMEQQILHRIDAYALERVDPIFRKIRNTIIEYNTSRNSERSLVAAPTTGGTPIKVPSSTPTFDVDVTDESAEGKMFGSTNVSTVLTSSPSEPPAPAELSMDEYFRPCGRNSSTPKTGSGRSSVTTSAAANRSAATLNTRRSSARWAQNRSASSRVNGSLSFGEATAVAATLNVSKSRSAAKVETTVVAAASPRKKQQRNFIQENIAKAAQRQVKVVRSGSSTAANGNSTATSSTVSLASRQQKPQQQQQRRGARVVVPPASSPPKINGGTPIRSNPASIFARNPFDTAPEVEHVNGAMHPKSAEAEEVVDNVNGYSSHPVSAQADVSASAEAHHHSLDTGTESELGFSQSAASSRPTSGSDPQYEAEVAAIQQNIERLLAAQDACAAAAVDAQLDGLGAETARLSACIAQCDERLATLRLDGVAADLDEIEALHGNMEAERDGERVADSERLDDEWSRYHDLVHELEIEED